ncbi:dihydroxy-acid dehydratase [Streptomyces sp. NPDC057684]|uniref:dihydroxy-acid dehydratase domain-containing protein n=1 Tax=Streptomyces sp. NPDC057684 TaxID=3346211 RepID=UPI0036B8375E
MARNLRSNFPIGSTQWAVRRAQWRALGITDADMRKPKIAVINSSSELSSCYSHLDGVAEAVKDGVRRAGGLPFEIPTVAPSDFVTSAGRSGRYLMPARDLLVNDIEVMVEGAQLDGMVCLSSCDKTTPAHLMAAARLDLPTILVPCGYQAHGDLDGEPVDIEDVFEDVGAVAAGRMPLERLCRMTDVAVCGAGVCAGMGTANTMQLAAEALGMALPGSSPVAAGGQKLLRSAGAAGERIVELVEEDLRPREILSRAAFANAVAASLALSGSVNLVRHLQAVAVELGSDTDLYNLVEEIGANTPVLCAVRPNGDTRIEDIERAGGTLGVLRQLGPVVDRTHVGVSGQPLSSHLDEVSVDEGVIRSVKGPLAAGPALVVMRGTLAPGAGLFKAGTRTDELRFDGPARVFESQEQALDALAAGRIRDGDITVLRGLGPVGGPGVASASWFVAALNGAGLGATVAVLTDGQLSGLNHGIVVGQISPEAADGGPLSLVRDGDRIKIDTTVRRVDLLVADEEMARREPVQLTAGEETGWLGMYRNLVEPLSRGAVLRRH